MIDKFELEEPTPKQTIHWWHGARYTPEWLEWVKKKSTWNFNNMNTEWNTKTCPFIDARSIIGSNKCTKCKCIHFTEGKEYSSPSSSTVSWYGEKMYSEHKCKLWGNR